MNADRQARSRGIHLAAMAFALWAAGASAAQPIRLHPDNPRWFEWRGKAVASNGRVTELAGPDFLDGIAVGLKRN